MSGSDATTALSVRNVIKRFGSGPNAVTALNNVSVEIQSNEFFTLLGPSGCGKTTLLRLTAGFEQPTEGEIFLFGQEIEDQADAEGAEVHIRVGREVGHRTQQDAGVFDGATHGPEMVERPGKR